MNTNGILPPDKRNLANIVDYTELRVRENTAFGIAFDSARGTALEDLFSIDWIRSFHKEIFGGLHEHAGAFRNEPIRVAWHIPPAHSLSEVEEQMDQYIADCRRRLALALLRPEAIPALIGFAFWKLTYIAPFADGNGRVANGMCMLLQHHFNMPGTPMYDRAETHEYAKFVYALRAYDTGNAAIFFEHLRKKLGLEEGLEE